LATSTCADQQYSSSDQLFPIKYSGRENLHLEASIDECIVKFTNLLQKYTLGLKMDLATKIQYFTLDVISKVGLGTSFAMLDHDADTDDYLKSSRGPHHRQYRSRSRLQLARALPPHRTLHRPLAA
jgi:hypothetical protein